MLIMMSIIIVVIITQLTYIHIAVVVAAVCDLRRR